MLPRRRSARHGGVPLAGFTAIAVLPALAMMGAFALVARDSSVEQWSALGIGTSLGAIIGLIVLYGWLLSGPVDVARASKAERLDLYVQSVADRGVLFCFVSLPSVGLAVLLSPPGVAQLTVAMTIATSLNGLSALWFSVGVGDPALCLRTEIAPKVLGTIGGAVSAVLFDQVLLFPALLAAGAGLGLAATSERVLEGHSWSLHSALATVPASLRNRGRAALTEVTGGVYSVASISLVGAVASAPVTAAFVSGDRFFRASLIPVSALSTTLQRSVSAAGPQHRRGPASRAFVAHLTLGTLGAVVVAVLGRPATSLLFGADLAVPQTAMYYFAIAYLAISLNTTLGRHVLASQGRVPAILVATSAGVLAGVAGILIGSVRHGVTGAAAGVAVGEATVLAVMCVALAAGDRGRRIQAEGL